jgi:hypothetical protein
VFLVKHRSVPRRQVIFLLGGGTLFALLRRFGFGKAQAATDGVGLVREVTGPGQVGQSDPLPAMEAGMPIFLGDRAITGAEGRAHLGFGERTEVHLGPQSELRIDTFIADAGGEIFLDGALIFDRPGPKSDSVLEVVTDYGRIGVRGTQFFAGPDKGGFGVFVVRGEVEVTAATQKVILTTGQGTLIKEKGAAPSRPSSWDRERVEAAFARVMGPRPEN